MRPDAGGLVYGTIIVATLLAAESARSETYGKTVGAVGLAMLTYWLLVSYSHYSGERLENEEGFEYSGFVRSAVRESTFLFGATPPLLAVLIVWATGGSLSLAVRVGVYVAAASILAAELVTGIRADLHGRALVRQTVVGAVFGLLLIALRLLLH
jgi:hypothetical protein